MTTELIARARAGDGRAFGQLTDPYRRELHVHCYRILGSVQDAEDALQETLVAAWQGLGGFQQRSSVRTWLYQIATNRALNALRAANRRPRMGEPTPPPGVTPPEPTRVGEVLWLEPYPDLHLEPADQEPGPEARYETKEAISLAFVTALQLLPPRQRAVLILRDVLGFPAKNVAEVMDTSTEAVSSALKRARTILKAQPCPGQPGAPAPNSSAERELVAQLAGAWESGDVAAIVALLTDDAWVTMPPVPLQYQGRELAAQFFTTVAFREGRRYRLVPTRANGQPAFGVYVHDPHTQVAHANGLLVLTLAGDQISAITRFDNSVLDHFGLPRLLPD